jgi:type IV secretory pathway VirB10-like protein
MPSCLRTVDIAATALACSLALGAAGCTHERVHAAVPVTATPIALSPDTDHPMTIAPDTDATPPIEAQALPPAISPAATPTPPAPMAIEPGTPPAPKHKPEEHQAQAEQPAAQHAPQIAPQISASDQSMYQRKTADDLAAAKHNLDQTNGKHLSAAQQDLADKIRSFMSQSQDASKGGDWDRAQNLAQKARLLSTELLNSL